MKRQITADLAACRREAAILAHPDLAQWGWALAAIAKKLEVPQGTVSRDLAATCESWREFPVYDFDKVPHGLNYARDRHIDAHNGPLCASARIIVELFLSHSGVRAFSIFPATRRDNMKFENHVLEVTQVIARQAEAAKSVGSRWRCRRLKICASAHIRDC